MLSAAATSNGLLGFANSWGSREGGPICSGRHGMASISSKNDLHDSSIDQLTAKQNEPLYR